MFRVAIVGSGNMANAWAKAVDRHSSFDLVGVLSRNASRAAGFAQRFHAPIVAQSVSELHEKSQADVVIVAISETKLWEIFLDLTSHPWVRILEKPAGIDYEEARLMAEASLKLDDATYVALNRRFYSSTMELVNQLEDENGRRIIQIADQHDTELAGASGKDVQVIRNWMYANAIHTVDLFRVLGRGSWAVKDCIKTDVSSSAFVIRAFLESSEGDWGTYTSVWNLGGKWSVTCHGSQYVWEMSPLEDLRRTSRQGRQTTTFERSEGDVILKPGLWQMLNELESSLSGARTRLTTLAEGLDSVRLIRDLYHGGTRS